MLSDHADAASTLLAAAALMDHAGGAPAASVQRQESNLTRAGKPRRCEKSRDQKEILIRAFEIDPLPDFDRRQALATQLGITPRAVQVWFQNRRARLKTPLQPGGYAAVKAKAEQQRAMADDDGAMADDALRHTSMASTSEAAIEVRDLLADAFTSCQAHTSTISSID